MQEQHGKKSERIPLSEAEGRVCAEECGLFPPCVPLIQNGEVISREKSKRLLHAKNTFGLINGEILVYTEEK